MVYCVMPYSTLRPVVGRTQTRSFVGDAARFGAPHGAHLMPVRLMTRERERTRGETLHNNSCILHSPLNDRASQQVIYTCFIFSFIRLLSDQFSPVVIMRIAVYK